MNKKNSTSETLSRKLNESDAVTSYLNTAIDGLTKTVDALNQSVQWMCVQINDVSICKIVGVRSITDIR